MIENGVTFKEGFLFCDRFIVIRRLRQRDSEFMPIATDVDKICFMETQ